MDERTRYNLMVKLSDFYVNNVENELNEFEKARCLAIISRASFYLILIITFLLPICIFVFHRNIESKTMTMADVVAMIMLCCGIIFLIAHEYIINRINKKNIIRISHNKIHTPDEEIKRHLMEPFVKIFGDFTWQKSNHSYAHNKYEHVWKSIDFIKNLKILKNPISSFDDCITGKYNEIGLDIFDADTSFLKFEHIVLATLFTIFLGAALTPYLSPLSFVILIIILLKHFTSKGFKGVIVEMNMNKNFKGHTFILEKNNIKDNLTIDSNIYEKIDLEDIEFSKEFNVYSQNQIEARYILTTAFMDRLKNLKEIYKAKYIRVAFKDKKIVILIHTGRDMFQMAGISTLKKETFVQLFDEITAVLDIVDTLKLNQDLGL